MTKVFLAAAAFALISTAAIAGSYVQGYTRSDGTYVQPHYRSAPDTSYNNNYEVRPNVNPYTFKQGTQQPTWNDKPPTSGLNWR